MKRRRLDMRIVHFFRLARRYVENTSPEELNWARKLSSRKFRQLRSQEFLAEYAWVVYVAGFRVAVIEHKFPALTRAFKDFDLKRLSRMKSLRPVLRVFGNRTRARCFLEGARQISNEGFTNFKRRIEEEGPAGLTGLPGIGEITKDHLARNVGLASIAKNDIWIHRLCELSRAPSHSALAGDLARRFREKPGVVDLILWRFCADAGWKSPGHRSLARFYGSL